MPAQSLPARIASHLDTLVAAVARAHQEDPAAAGLLVALSGGPDSVALLHLAIGWAKQHGRTLSAAHYDHRLRGEDSQRDRVFCQELCDRLGVALVTGHGDPRGLARQRGRGLEEAARHLRHDFLERTRQDQGLTAVALGHHQDDQAETVVMRLFRGTGLDGLRGMRPQHGRLIRPLLAIPRAELLDHLAAAGLPWREDATNLDGSNLRSRLRRELLPVVRQLFGDGAALAPARLADLAGADLDHLDQLADAAWNELSGPPLAGSQGPSLAVAAADLPRALARRVLRRWLHHFLPVDLACRHVDDVHRWLGAGQSGTGLDLPGPLRLERVFDRVGAALTPPPGEDVSRWRVRIEPLPAAPQPVPPAGRHGDGWRLICPAEALRGNLRLRHPRPGDRLEPLGLAGSKKLSDLMQEKRIPAPLREQVLVAEDDAGILWVVGLAQAERTRLLQSTRQAVTIHLDRRRPAGDE